MNECLLYAQHKSYVFQSKAFMLGGHFVKTLLAINIAFRTCSPSCSSVSPGSSGFEDKLTEEPSSLYHHDPSGALSLEPTSSPAQVLQCGNESFLPEVLAVVARDLDSNYQIPACFWRFPLLAHS